MPLYSLPVLIDPLIVLRLLHHWILSRKVGSASAQPKGKGAPPSSSSTRSRRPAVRRELSLPADERAITQLEAQLLPHVCVGPPIRPRSYLIKCQASEKGKPFFFLPLRFFLIFPILFRLKVNISFADDDDEGTEEVRQQSSSVVNQPGTGPTLMTEAAAQAGAHAQHQAPSREANNKVGRISSSLSPSAAAPNFNPTEAILATMQLIPMPCSKDGRLVMCREEIERSVSVIRSFAQAPKGSAATTTSSASTLLRRKSKSQTGLSELIQQSKATGFCDLEELRSFQRQLQNFPSLDELRRNPLQHPAPLHLSAKAAEINKPPPSPSGRSNSSARSTTPESVCFRELSTASTMKPTTSSTTTAPVTHQAVRPPMTRKMEDYALAILQILKVRFLSFLLFRRVVATVPG